MPSQMDNRHGDRGAHRSRSREAAYTWADEPRETSGPVDKGARLAHRRHRDPNVNLPCKDFGHSAQDDQDGPWRALWRFLAQEVELPGSARSIWGHLGP